MRLHKHYKLLFIALAMFQFVAYAQNTLKGKVTEASRGETLPGVIVYIPELHKGSTTNINGEYVLSNIPNGIYLVQYNLLGFKTELIKIQFEANTIVKDVSMIHAAVESHEIVVSGGFYGAQDETAVKIESISMEEINKSGDISLMQSIAKTPGVSLISTGSGIAKPVIRGLSGNRILVVSNGVRLENQQWGDEHGLGMNEYGVERVEIIKGPASLLYGSDAMGGVISLIDERAAPDGKVMGDYNAKLYSNTLGYNTNIGLKGTSKKIDWRIRGGAESHADYIGGKSQNVTNSRFENNTLKAGLGFSGKKIISKINYSYFKQGIGIVEGDNLNFNKKDVGRLLTAPYQGIDNHLLSLQNTLFLNRSKLKLNLSWQDNIRKEFEEENAVTFDALNMHLSTIGYDLKYYVPSKKYYEFVLGAQGMYQQNKNFGDRMLIPDAELTDHSLFGFGKYDREKLDIQAGLRYTYRQVNTDQSGIKDSSGYFNSFQRKFSNLSGSVGSTYSFNEHLLFRLNVAAGFRAPNLPELSSNGIHEGTKRYEVGNQNLKSERNVETDLSSHFHSQHISASISMFYNNIDNYIYLAPTDSVKEGEKVFTYKQSNAALLGGEASVDIHPHPLDWFHLNIGYSYVQGIRSDGSSLPLIPPGKLLGEIKLDKERLWKLKESFFTFGATYVFKQSKIDEFEATTPGYFLLNLGVGANLQVKNQKISFGINASNLLDVAYYDHLSRLKYDGVYNIGRNLSFYLKVPFSVGKEL